MLTANDLHSRQLRCTNCLEIEVALRAFTRTGIPSSGSQVVPQVKQSQKIVPHSGYVCKLAWLSARTAAYCHTLRRELLYAYL